MFNVIFPDDWIRTGDHWCHKWRLCQLLPFRASFSYKSLLSRHTNEEKAQTRLLLTHLLYLILAYYPICIIKDPRIK